MIALSVYLAVMFADWMIGNTCHASLMDAYVSISVLLFALMMKSEGTSLLYRTLLVAIFIDSVVDVFVLAGYLSGSGDVDIPALVLFVLLMLYLSSKDYKIPSHCYMENRINILLYRPHSLWDVAKGFIGIPVSSVCLSTHNKVWSFRRKSGKFERLPYNKTWENSHIIINTNIVPTIKILAELDAVIGESRYPFCKCIWSIRRVLRLMGLGYEPRWFDYIPGVYAAKIIKDA